jgi:hypothetical protein
MSQADRRTFLKGAAAVATSALAPGQPPRPEHGKHDNARLSFSVALQVWRGIIVVGIVGTACLILSGSAMLFLFDDGFRAQKDTKHP